MKTLLLAMLAVIAFVALAHAKKLTLSVRIVERQANSSQYTFTVPGYASSNCSLYGYGTAASLNCAASGMPARSAQFFVHGATLSLLLPDKRIVVVTCDAKANWTDWHQGMWRSCRQPVTDTVEAEFNGDNARLEWSVSLDGRKKQNETYKIIGVLSKISARPGGVQK